MAASNMLDGQAQSMKQIYDQHCSISPKFIPHYLFLTAPESYGSISHEFFKVLRQQSQDQVELYQEVKNLSPMKDGSHEYFPSVCRRRLQLQQRRGVRRQRGLLLLQRSREKREKRNRRYCRQHSIQVSQYDIQLLFRFGTFDSSLICLGRSRVYGAYQSAQMCMNQFKPVHQRAIRAYYPDIYCELVVILTSLLLDLVAMKLLMKLARARYVYTAIVYTAIAIDVSAV